MEQRIDAQHVHWLLWAKQPRGEPLSTNYHPLLCHLIDVALVAQALWDRAELYSRQLAPSCETPTGVGTWRECALLTRYYQRFTPTDVGTTKSTAVLFTGFYRILPWRRLRFGTGSRGFRRINSATAQIARTAVANATSHSGISTPLTLQCSIALALHIINLHTGGNWLYTTAYTAEEQ